jgi:hypothetical protein
MKQKELTEAIAEGVHEGISKILKDFLWGLLLFLGIFFFCIGIWAIVHTIRYGQIPQQLASKPSNIDGWANDYSCFYDNEITACGKTQYCATHISQEECLTLNGTWELETQARFYEQWLYWDILNHNPEIPKIINQTK